MNNLQLFNLLYFEHEKNLKEVNILSRETLCDGGTFLISRLTYPEKQMCVPFIYYEGCDWIFTPMDWQGPLPSTSAGISSIDWRVNNIHIPADIVNGLPHIC